MRRMILLALTGCGGHLYVPHVELGTATRMQKEADVRAYQQDPKAVLSEIRGQGITEEGLLSPNGIWRYRYSSPTGAIEIAFHGDGKRECTRPRTFQKGKLPKYGMDSPKAIRLGRPTHFPIDITLVASGSTPYWILQGKWLKAVD